MPDQYRREPLTDDKASCLANACETFKGIPTRTLIQLLGHDCLATPEPDLNSSLEDLVREIREKW